MFGIKSEKKANAIQVVELTRQNETLYKAVAVLTENLHQYNIQEHVSNRYYNTRESMIAETVAKYKGIAKYGNQVLQRLINLRVAFSVPNRLFVRKNPLVDSKDEEVEATKEFVKNFMAFNGLDGDTPKNLAKEIEMQGQVLLELVWNTTAKLPSILYYPWNKVGYTIVPDNPYEIKTTVTAKMVIEGKNKEIADDECVFIGFNDVLHDYIGYPTCGPILRHIEDLDLDLADWRKLNHLFAHPTPHFKCETQEEAFAVNTMITSTGWKVGTAIATSSEFGLKGPSGVEASMLMSSITTLAKIISAHTGIGIHFLGFANVMSNRATADSMGEPTEVVLHSEITSWNDFYYRMFVKAIRMRNSKLNGKLPEDCVVPVIVPMTDRQWKNLIDVYIPLAGQGLISNETLLDEIPGIDSAEEMRKIEEQEKKKSKIVKDKKGIKDKKKKEEEFEDNEEEEE
jgi:hypothetical protein